MTYIIRTSDRAQFKRCRQMWDFGSKIRQDFTPAVAAKPLDFGTAIHKALQVYYEPSTWQDDRAVVEAEALLAFNEICNEQKQGNLRVSSGDMSIEVESDFKERRALGEGMLQNYFRYAWKHDDFTPLKVEVEFEVPIPFLIGSGVLVSNQVDRGIGFTPLYASPQEAPPHHLTNDGELVVYQGRIDLLVQDSDGRYWIWDHKTTAQLAETAWLTVDDQITSYCWALQQMLNIPIAGFIYNELAKKVPHPPRVLNNGSLSVAKNQDTDYYTYMQAIKAGGYDPSAYVEMLRYLRDNPKEYVRRTRVQRSPKELETQSRRICMEAIDMLSDPFIYPAPSKINCNGCWFRIPCLATQDGSDVEWILKSQYKKRSDVNQPA